MLKAILFPILILVAAIAYHFHKWRNHVCYQEYLRRTTRKVADRVEWLTRSINHQFREEGWRLYIGDLKVAVRGLL